MKLTIVIAALLFFNYSYSAFGQNILTKQAAVQLAIDNNYNIQLAQNNILIAANNTSKQANGYYPTVDASVGPTATFGGSTQRFNNEMTAEVREAISWTAGATVNANYTLFDPERDLQFKQLKEQLNLTNLQLRQTIENTVFEVYNQYFQIAQLEENLRAVEEALSLSRKRLERAQLRYELSQGLRLDILNAQVDVSRDSVNFLNAYQQVINAKRDLDVIMGVPVSGDFSIDPQVSYDNNISKESLVEDALENNVSLMLSDQNQVLNQFDLDIIGAGNKPKIGTNAGLSYNYQNNAPGSFITSSTSSGINVGVTLNWNIFDGGRRRILAENSKLSMETESLTRDQIVKELQRDIDNAWDNYQNALFVLEVEQKSLEINRLNLERTIELYNAGQQNSVEFRQAQLNLLNSETGYNAARFDAKLIELQLVYLSGGILEYSE